MSSNIITLQIILHYFFNRLYWNNIF